MGTTLRPLLACLCAVVLLCQQCSGQRASSGLARFFTSVDTDGDGQIEAHEAEAFMGDSFAKWRTTRCTRLSASCMPISMAQTRAKPSHRAKCTSTCTACCRSVSGSCWLLKPSGRQRLRVPCSPGQQGVRVGEAFCGAAPICAGLPPELCDSMPGSVALALSAQQPRDAQPGCTQSLDFPTLVSDGGATLETDLGVRLHLCSMPQT